MPDSLPTGLGEGVSLTEDKITKVAEETLGQFTPPEVEPYSISFVNYKEDKCKIDGMNGNDAKMVVKIIKDIGIHFKSKENFLSKQSCSSEIKPVMNSSPYDDYYKKLPDEIVDAQEVREIKYKDTRQDKEVDLRIFYYTLSSVFYMLAITAGVHENLDHKPHFFKNNKKRRW
ncbi:MAG: hypothetical protein WCI41_02095 [bacterium]